MCKILITGSSGFVGKNLSNYLQDKSFNILSFSREFGLDYGIIDSNYINLNAVEVIIHLAGKAHDLKNASNEEDYISVNTNLTIAIFDSFLKSKAKKFIYLSSVKAVKDQIDTILTEEVEPCPSTPYGKSKLKSEIYISSKMSATEKIIYILRPCMIHGPGNKGNLNFLYRYIQTKLPWPLGAFNNQRSFCSIKNLSFVINELLESDEIPCGVYNISDDSSLSTNDIIRLMNNSLNYKVNIVKVNKKILFGIARIGDFLGLQLNTETLKKLTENYVVSNRKIKNAMKKEMPVTIIDGLIETIEEFKK